MKLQIAKSVYGGAGLAHEPGGKTVLVPFTLPGEMIEAQLLEHKKTSDEASLLQVVSASKDRVKPACSHFGECGGCHYQHAEYPAQIKIKSSILQETLERAGLIALPNIESHLGPQWGYRNRVRLRIEELDGAPRVGYSRRGTNEFLAIHECPIAAPLLWRAAQSFLQVAAQTPSAARWLSNAVEVEFFTSGDEKKLQMTLFVRKNQPGLTASCEHLKQVIPELTGAGTSLLKLTGPQRQVQKPRPLESWGATGLSYRAADEDYWISRGGFFQVNRFLIDELVRIVTADRNGQLAWDLYAGVGLFSRVLAKKFRQVVAVETAGTDLINSFKGPGKHAVEAMAVDFLRHAVIQRERPQLIVMDPPRAGVGADVCSFLARIAAPEMVYISCDPVTLARDLKMLVDAGYKLQEVHLVDLFPQTFHLETVVVLRK
jgi:23S rRNA (uracil1939-C5)-methyltransferase